MKIVGRAVGIQGGLTDESFEPVFERVHDIPRTQALGVEGEDLVVHLGQVGLALADELRLEGGVTVARRLDGDLSVLAF